LTNAAGSANIAYATGAPERLLDFIFHFHAVRTISWSAECSVRQPSDCAALLASATRLGGSPALRPVYCTGTFRPETRSTIDITSRTE